MTRRDSWCAPPPMHSSHDIQLRLAVLCDQWSLVMQEYLEQVKKGEKKIASGALKPHELVEEAMR